MSELILPSREIAVAFLLIAVACAAAGPGVGTSNAVPMIVFGPGSDSIPGPSLLPNPLVSAVSCFDFIRRGHLGPELIAPFLVLPLGLAWLGGIRQLPESVYRLLMALSAPF